jgi:hypothetical protein
MARVGINFVDDRLMRSRKPRGSIPFLLFVGIALLLNWCPVRLQAAPGLLALLRVHHAVAEGAAQQVVCLLVQLLVFPKR